MWLYNVFHHARGWETESQSQCVPSPRNGQFWAINKIYLPPSTPNRGTANKIIKTAGLQLFTRPRCGTFFGICGRCDEMDGNEFSLYYFQQALSHSGDALLAPPIFLFKLPRGTIHLGLLLAGTQTNLGEE